KFYSGEMATNRPAAASTDAQQGGHQMSRLNRRTFIARAGATASSVALLSALGPQAFGQDKQIRHFWWGNPERDKRTFAVIDLYNSKTPGTVVSGESLGFADYFT